jgi:GNAT superfamily N-acetyltransferase
MKIPDDHQSIEISIIDENSVEAYEVNELVDIVNVAYRQGESGICIPNLVRITERKLLELIATKELLGLRVAGLLKGCIAVKASPYASGSALFGMLALDHDMKYRNKGYGSLLVKKAEGFALENGFGFMDLELLKPTLFAHDHKNRLEAWYEKIGYVYQFSSIFTNLELLIIKDYDFKIYRKALK